MAISFTDCHDVCGDHCWFDCQSSFATILTAFIYCITHIARSFYLGMACVFRTYFPFGLKFRQQKVSKCKKFHRVGFKFLPIILGI